MSGSRFPTFTKDNISTNDRILECMGRFMSREEIVDHLSNQFQTSRDWINTVFDNLERENPDKFKLYYESLAFAQQSFNFEPDQTASLPGASSSSQIRPEAAIPNAGVALIPQLPCSLGMDPRQSFPGAASSSEVPPEASVIGILTQMLGRLDQMLTKQDQILRALIRKRERTEGDQVGDKGESKPCLRVSSSFHN